MSKKLVEVFAQKWKSYRHRFVPWIALNLQKKQRTLRQVKHKSEDKWISDEQVLATLSYLFTALLKNDARNQSEKLRLLANSYQYLNCITLNAETQDVKVPPTDTMLQVLGFCVEKRPSLLESAGTGVFVTKGLVPKGVTVAMYPGTVYQSGDPILIQSIRNTFVFRCIDGVLIDGNDKGLSKLVFRSCNGRDRLGPFFLNDSSWLTSHPENPLAVGQYVNNCSNEKAANVCYQEFDVPYDFPLELCQYLPNANYSIAIQRKLRCVVLISLREINKDEELFSNYFTIVKNA